MTAAEAREKSFANKSKSRIPEAVLDEIKSAVGNGWFRCWWLGYLDDSAKAALVGAGYSVEVLVYHSGYEIDWG